MQVIHRTVKIPDIDFNQKRSPIAGIELIALDELRQRQVRLDLTHSPSEPHRIMFHALIYISQGEGAHFIDFNRYPFQTGCFIFVNKHQVHAYDFKNQPLLKIEAIGLQIKRHSIMQRLDKKDSGQSIKLKFRHRGNTANSDRHRLKRLFQKYKIPPWKRVLTPQIYLDDELVDLWNLPLDER